MKIKKPVVCYIHLHLQAIRITQVHKPLVHHNEVAPYRIVEELFHMLFNHIKENAMEKKPEATVSEKSNTRRDFLKYSSLLGSAALLSGPVLA
ncbi:MAG: twin-arginine translocation signal domain-containing protein, partial [Deltaproteobacteria bacterium]|nr:twin-arginine translocation signal domain-containing protein [Deltaproteobacteria bacterium]